MPKLGLILEVSDDMELEYMLKVIWAAHMLEWSQVSPGCEIVHLARLKEDKLP